MKLFLIGLVLSTNIYCFADDSENVQKSVASFIRASYQTNDCTAALALPNQCEQLSIQLQRSLNKTADPQYKARLHGWVRAMDERLNIVEAEARRRQQEVCLNQQESSPEQKAKLATDMQNASRSCSLRLKMLLTQTTSGEDFQRISNEARNQIIQENRPKRNKASQK